MENNKDFLELAESRFSVRAFADKKVEKEVIEKMKEFPALIGNSIEKYRFREAQAELMNLARLGNKYLTDMEPWKKQKEHPESVKTVMHLSLQICANLSVLCEPFLPFTAEKIRHMMNLSENLRWHDAGNAELLAASTQMEKPVLLFEQIDDATIEGQVNKLVETKKQNELQAWTPKSVKETVAFDDFGKMDIRVGTVLECTKVPKADKLLQFKIEDGMGGMCESIQVLGDDGIVTDETVCGLELEHVESLLQSTWIPVLVGNDPSETG